MESSYAIDTSQAEIDEIITPPHPNTEIDLENVDMDVDVNEDPSSWFLEGVIAAGLLGFFLGFGIVWTLFYLV